MTKQNYKFTIIYDCESEEYSVSGYTHHESFGTRGPHWAQDGGIVRYKTYDEVLESLKDSKNHTVGREAK